MKGFDPKFRDFPDFIIGVTKEIWEDRGIDTLHKYYAPDIVVRSPAAVVVGNKDVIAATMATLSSRLSVRQRCAAPISAFCSAASSCPSRSPARNASTAADSCAKRASRDSALSAAAPPPPPMPMASLAQPRR